MPTIQVIDADNSMLKTFTLRAFDEGPEALAFVEMNAADGEGEGTAAPYAGEGFGMLLATTHTVARPV